MLWLLRFLPKNALSLLFGKFAFLRLPQSFTGFLIRRFVVAYNVNIEEAEKPIEAYPSLGAFFIRKLKPEVRQIEEGLVSPCDGSLEQFGDITNGTLLQAKGIDYSVHELIKDDCSTRFVGGSYFTLYLSPKDYHRVHFPISGVVERSIHVEGSLWPVNGKSVATISTLFCINERVSTLMDSELGKVCIVMVGATNVGSIELCYDQRIKTNDTFRPFDYENKVTVRGYPGLSASKGEELGVFKLGSTVILLTEKKMHYAENLVRGPIILGKSLGSI